MIPQFNQSGVLPAFIGDDPCNLATRSPYVVTLTELINHFSTSNERINILKGFLNYRVALKKIGIQEGFQWMDGSFVENIEENQNRAPRDIDIVTLTHFKSEDHFKTLNMNNVDLFHPSRCKKTYYCDAFFINLNASPIAVARNVTYWYGLFSHQRSTSIWKGMLEIDLSEDESDAFKLLINGDSNAS